jgi:hypothetical protein
VTALFPPPLLAAPRVPQRRAGRPRAQELPSAVARCRAGKQGKLLQVVDGASGQSLATGQMKCTKAALTLDLTRVSGRRAVLLAMIDPVRVHEGWRRARPGGFEDTDEVTGGLRLCAPHPFLDKSGDSRPGKHSR